MTGAASARERIGFIGLGVLGSAIAPHLVADGYTVIGCDIDPARVDALGVARADSPRALAGGCDVLILCLPTVEALHEVVSGADGLDKGVSAGQIVLEISTFPVREKERARDRLAAVGAVLLDCPVSGNRIHAQRKGLTAFGSGERVAYDKIEPILRAFTKKTHYVGAFGCGMKMKLIGNMLNLIHNSAAAEIMVLGMKSGLDPRVIHEVISGSASSSSMFEVRGALMARNDYHNEGMNFSIPLKDARIISAHAADLACPIPVYQAALQPYYAAVAQGHHDEDAAAVCAAMELAANHVRGT
jgi:3-hydroxyisobutyrate dehydrogenase-like beta-hydroxyacid dehydrogenase